MVKFIRLFALAVPVALSAQYEGFPQKVVLFEEGCEAQTTCRTNLRGQDKDFSLRWESFTEGTTSFIAMEINGQIFNVSTSLELIRSYPFPLRMYVFSPSLKLYGSLAASGTGGVYIHYFSRDGDGVFHYLGRRTFISYDADSGYLIGGEKFSASEYQTYYYKLVDNSLVLERTENSLDEQ